MNFANFKGVKLKDGEQAVMISGKRVRRFQNPEVVFEEVGEKIEINEEIERRVGNIIFPFPKKSPKKEEQVDISKNPFYKVFSSVSEDIDVIETKILIENIISQFRGLVGDILGKNNQKNLNILYKGDNFSKLNQDFKEDVCYLTILEKFIWKDGKKPERKDLLKIIKELRNSPDKMQKSLGEYLYFISKDSKEKNQQFELKILKS